MLWCKKLSLILLIAFCFCLFRTIIIQNFGHHTQEKGLQFYGNLKYQAIGLDQQILNSSISKLHKRVRYLKNLIKEMKRNTINTLQQASKELLVVRKPEREMTYDDQEYFDMSSLCDGSGTLKLLILVVSEYYEIEERKAFREAWKKLREKENSKGNSRNNKELKWKTLFVIGRDYKHAREDWYHINEIIFHRDLINIHSNRTNTMGAFYGALYWAQNACSYENILIIRPQMVVNFERMYALLQTLTERGRRKDYFVRATVPANKTVHRALYERSAWLASYETLGKMLPLMKHDFDSNESINYTKIWNTLDSVTETTRLRFNEFLSDPLCEYQERYIVNVVYHYTCLNHIMDAFEARDVIKE